MSDKKDMFKNASPKDVVNGMAVCKEGGNKLPKILSVLFFILAVIYLVLPWDYDDAIVGMADDFLLFMAAFCYMYSQFIGKGKGRAVLLLRMLSFVFCLLAAIAFILLVFFR